jgi:transposase-like protein
MSADSIALNCPKCRAGMAHVSATPHPIVAGMQRNTFVCYACNETRTYVLPAMTAATPAK